MYPFVSRAQRNMSGPIALPLLDGTGTASAPVAAAAAPTAPTAPKPPVLYRLPLYDGDLESQVIEKSRPHGADGSDFPFFKVDASYYSDQKWYPSIPKFPHGLTLGKILDGEHANDDGTDTGNGLAEFIAQCQNLTTPATPQEERCLFCNKSLAASRVNCDIGYGAVHYQCAAVASDSYDVGASIALQTLYNVGVIRKNTKKVIPRRCRKCTLRGAGMKCQNWQAHMKEAKQRGCDVRELPGGREAFIHLPCAQNTGWHLQIKKPKVSALCPFCWTKGTKVKNNDGWVRFTTGKQLAPPFALPFCFPLPRACSRFPLVLTLCCAVLCCSLCCAVLCVS
jgi:hypothetical protein